MKKWIYITISISIIILLTLILWLNAAKVISFLLSSDFRIPISIEQISYKNKIINASNIEIKNLSGSKIKTGLETKELSIHSSISNLFKPKLEIDYIKISDTQLNVEFYNKSGSENNWSKLLNVKTYEKNDSSDYLIKQIEIRNLSVTTYDQKGIAKTYPTIKRLVIQNISAESGFPINEIEKAIISEMLKSVFLKLDLKHLIQSLNPFKIMPNIFRKIPFIGENSSNEKEEKVKVF